MKPGIEHAVYFPVFFAPKEFRIVQSRGYYKVQWRALLFWNDACMPVEAINKAEDIKDYCESIKDQKAPLFGRKWKEVD